MTRHTQAVMILAVTALALASSVIGEMPLSEEAKRKGTSEERLNPALLDGLEGYPSENLHRAFRDSMKTVRVVTSKLVPQHATVRKGRESPCLSNKRRFQFR